MYSNSRSVSPTHYYPSNKQYILLPKNNLVSVSQELINQIIILKDYSLNEIANEAQIPIYTLRRLQKGIVKQPRLSIFQNLLALYCRACL